MCIVRFTSDLHFRHINMAVNYRHFSDVYAQDEYIISQWNKVVKRRDLTYILGDVTMEKKDHYYLLDQLNGHKIVVLGNHDLPQHTEELLKYVDKVAGCIDYKGCVLTHIPISETELIHHRKNIHGHIHNARIDNDKYVNVCVDLHDYTPKTLEELGVGSK